MDSLCGIVPPGSGAGHGGWSGYWTNTGAWNFEDKDGAGGRRACHLQGGQASSLSF